MYERYQTVRLHLMGNSIKQISTILNRTKKTIGTYIRPYKRHGLEGLTMKFSTGKATSNVSVANNMMQAYYLIKNVSIVGHMIMIARSKLNGSLNF
nr:helix-turn-helix domain-containing protein [uncultured Bacillus sp.]